MASENLCWNVLQRNLPAYGRCCTRLCAATLNVKTTLRIVLCAACYLLGACASRPTPPPARRSAGPVSRKPTDTDTPFGQHPSSTVRGAARFGSGIVGAVV